MTIWDLLLAAIYFYLILLSMRILLSWFRGAVYGRPWELLIRVTDPYLSLFSGLRFLRRGVFDFTPIAAILVLVVLQDLILAVQRFGKITLGILFGAVAGAVWRGFAFLLVLFLVLAVLRLIFLAARRGQGSPLGSLIATLVEPVLAPVRRLLQSGRSLSETSCLLLTIAMLLVLRLVGGFLAGLLVTALYRLPV